MSDLNVIHIIRYRKNALSFGIFPVILWVQFPVGAGSSHTKDFKNGSNLYLHGAHDEVGTTKHNWSARCQYNVTGWVSMWAYDMLYQ